MISKIRRHIMFVGFVLFSFLLKAEAPQGVVFNHISVENGLAHNTVNDFAQDEAGYVWVATMDGLCRFDGHDFITYRESDNDTLGLRSSLIQAVLVDDKNQLWIGTGGGGLSLYDRDENVFYSFLFPPEISDYLSMNKVLSLFQDSRGNIWVGTAAGLYRLIENDTQKGDFNLHYVKGFEGYSITSIDEDSKGLIWLGLDYVGLGYFKYDQRDVAGVLPLKETGSSSKIESMIVDRYDQVWVGTKEAIYIYNPTKKQFKQFAKMRSVHDFYEDDEGIWLASIKEGLIYYNFATERLKKYNYTIDSDHFYTQKAVRIFKDRQGNLWIGNFYGGINFLNYNKRFFNHYTKGERHFSVNDENIISFFEDREGIVWIGADKGGLNRYDPRTEIYRYFYPNKESAKDKQGSVICIYEDSRDCLWLGSNETGLMKFDRKTEEFTSFLFDAHSSNCLSSSFVETITEDKDKNLWVGTNGGGITIFEVDNKEFHWLQNDKSDSSSISSNNITAIHIDRKERIWVASWEGLNLFHEKDSSFTRYYSDDTDPRSLPHNSVVSMLETESGEIWFATFGGGIAHYRSATNDFDVYDISNGLSSNIILSLEEDKKGNIWFSSNSGLTRYLVEDSLFENYYKEDGALEGTFRTDCSFRKRNGDLYFGGYSGFNVFNPDSVIFDFKNTGKVIFTDLKVLNEKVNAEVGGIITQHISDVDKIVLSPKQFTFSLSYNIIDFVAPDRCQFEYLMEGFDEKWVVVGNKREATYTNLDPGEYVFRVRGANSNGVWDKEGTSILIVIEPPFYKTFWFKSIVIILLLLAIILIYRMRIQTVINRNRTLEILVRERTIETEAQKHEIEEKSQALQENYVELERQQSKIETKNEQLIGAQSELKLINLNLEDEVEKRTVELKKTLNQLIESNEELDTFLYKASHDLKGPIATILGLAEIGKIEMKEEGSVELIDRIEVTALRMDKALEKLLDVHALVKNESEFKKINIKALAKEIKDFWGKFAASKGVELRTIIDVDQKMTSDPLLVKIILEALIENAIMFCESDNPVVKINMSVFGQDIFIKVEDNGVGISPKVKDKIFKMFYRGNEASKGNGLGLYLVKRVTDKLGGNITVDSEEGEFTTVIVKIPNKQK